MKLGKCIDNTEGNQAEQELVIGKIYTIENIENIDFYAVKDMVFFRRRFKILEGNEKILTILYADSK